MPTGNLRLLAAIALAAVLLLNGCAAGSPAAPAAAPASEAPAADTEASAGVVEARATPAAEAEAEAAAPAAEASSGADAEAPPVMPADQAPEATPPGAPGSGTGTGDAAGTDAAAPAARLFALVPGGTEAQYAVEEEFFGQAVPFVTAIGRTSALDGTITLAFPAHEATASGDVRIVSSSFTADISTLTSDSPRRDRAIRERWLESGRYPLATFVASGMQNMPADVALGEDASFQLTGDMTIRDVMQPLTWDVTARLDGQTLTGQATTFLMMRDFGFAPPDIAGILRVTDGVTVTVQFTAQEVVQEAE
jgi:polyisoprenoid-binding protein YceI